MKPMKHSKLFYLILSLFFSLLLFFNANNSSQEMNFQEKDGTDIYNEEVLNVPIELQYDKEKYFVTLNQEDVNVRLNSKNKVALDAESNKQTRHFIVSADLRDYGPGTYTVPLKVKNLNTAIKASVSPKKVRVIIAPRETKEVRVKTNVNASWLAKDLELKKVSVQPDTVKISTSTTSMQSICSVIAYLPERTNVDKDFQAQAEVKAYDASGQEVPIEVSPEQVLVKVDVDRPQKTVALNLIQEGTPAKGVENYQFLCDTQKIQLQGKQNALQAIHSVNVYVNIDNVSKTLTRKVSISLPKGVKGNITAVTVTVIPQLKRNS